MKRASLAAAAVFVLAVAAYLLLHRSSESEPASTSVGGLVVLAAKDDPYAPLASEIAQAEGAPLAQDWQAALAIAPRYLLWVAAPQELTDQAMVEAGLALREQGEFPAVGLITGADQLTARALWQRSGQARDGKLFAANGEYPTAGIMEARLQQTPGPGSGALTRESLAAALREASYVSFTGHGAARYLRLDDETTFRADDLPDLPPLVIGTASCQTLRPWQPESIALSFIQRGAAAYAGFVFSPLEGYLVGEFRELPFRYTYPDFPVGMVAALQNRGTIQGFAGFPFYFLIGDPRVTLQDAPPYRLKDEQLGKTRRLTAAEAPAGLIPVRIESGARYRFVEIDSAGAAADGDPFYNARLQTASLGEDRYILFVHPGGPFTIRLSERPPLFWAVARPLTDAFDHVILFTPQNGGDMIMLAAGGTALLTALVRLLWKVRKRLNAWSLLAAAGTVGLLSASVQALYMYARLPLSAITSKPLTFNAWWLVGVYLLSASGAISYLSARRWTGRTLGLLTAVFPALAPGVFVLCMITVMNVMIASQGISASVYNLNMAMLGLIAAGVEGLFFLLAFSLAGRFQGWPAR